MAAAYQGGHGVVFLGHSYIRRLRDFIATAADSDIQFDFRLSDIFGTVNVYFEGLGGAHIPQVINNAASVLAQQQFPVKVVVIQIEGNDIADWTDHETLANHVVSAAEYIHLGLGVDQVVISQLFFRDFSLVPDYNNIVHRVNFAISRKIAHYEGNHVVLWRHSGFWALEARTLIMLPDGVHFNDIGNEKYYKSLKSCLVQALKRALN